MGSGIRCVDIQYGKEMIEPDVYITPQGIKPFIINMWIKGFCCKIRYHLAVMIYIYAYTKTIVLWQQGKRCICCWQFYQYTKYKRKNLYFARSLWSYSQNLCCFCHKVNGINSIIHIVRPTVLWIYSNLLYLPYFFSVFFYTDIVLTFLKTYTSIFESFIKINICPYQCPGYICNMSLMWGIMLTYYRVKIPIFIHFQK